jgi:outer membrane protein TolC
MIRSRRWRSVAPSTLAPFLCLVIAPYVARADGPGDARASSRLSIDDAMRLAVDQAPAVVAARAEVTHARANVTSARSALYPQINGSASYVRTIKSEYDGLFSAPEGMGMGMGSGVALPFGRANTWRLGLSGSQLLFAGGKVTAGLDAADATVAQAGTALASARAQVVLQVTEAYYDAALATELVTIGEATLAQAEDTLKKNQASFEHGAIPEYDVLSAEVTRDNTRADLVRQRSQRDLAYAQLRRLVGLPQSQALELASPLAGDGPEIASHAASAAGVVPSATRAPVAQAGDALRVRQASLGAARGGHWPQVSLTSDLGIVNYPEDVFPGTDDWRTNFTVGVTLSVPLFTGFQVTGDVRAAEADVVVARAQLEDARRLAEVDRLDAEQAVHVAEELWHSSGRSVQQAQRAYEIAEARYQQGVSIALELVDARLALAQARVNQARAARDLHVARVRWALLPALPLGAGGASGAVGASSAGGAPTGASGAAARPTPATGSAARPATASTPTNPSRQP